MRENARKRETKRERGSKLSSWIRRRVFADGARSHAAAGGPEPGMGAENGAQASSLPVYARGPRGEGPSHPALFSSVLPLLMGTNRGYCRQRAVSYYARAQLYANSKSSSYRPLPMITRIALRISKPQKSYRKNGFYLKKRGARQSFKSSLEVQWWCEYRNWVVNWGTRSRIMRVTNDNAGEQRGFWQSKLLSFGKEMAYDKIKVQLYIKQKKAK